jgi:hypothetical protein
VLLATVTTGKNQRRGQCPSMHEHYTSDTDMPCRSSGISQERLQPAPWLPFSHLLGCRWAGGGDVGGDAAILIVDQGGAWALPVAAVADL